MLARSSARFLAACVLAWSTPALAQVSTYHFHTDASTALVFEKVGYFKAMLHEVGHALGLTHPWSPLKDQPESFPIKRGGTVMNGFAFAKPTGTQPPAYYRDDPFGNVALKPTICDIYGVVDAAFRQ